MHLHASFSEYTASYEAHLSEARRLGVDVLWWTDHDFRVSAQGYRHAVRFDGPVESEGEPECTWTWTQESDGTLSSSGYDFITEPRSPDEPGMAMRLHARAGDPGTGTFWCHGNAWNRRYSTSLADTTLELDVLPEILGEGGMFVLEIQSSYHPAASGRPAGKYRLQYRLGGFERHHRFTEADGLVGVVEQPVPVGRWYRLTVRPVEDIAALWPDLVAADNALSELRLGVRTLDGKAARVVVDRLRFHRAERTGRASLDLRRRVLEAYAERFADVRHYESIEVSLVRHLNWFGGALSMPDYSDGPILHDWSIDSAISMVDFIHEHGGLVSFNHPLTPMYTDGSPTGLSELVVRTQALGADLVEIGHNEQLDDLLRVFDVAARNAVFVTGTGVSDDHTAEDWIHQRLNYLTHVWSASVELPDLMQSLRRGRAWFADAGAWRGAFDIEVTGEPAMGGVVRTMKDRLPVCVVATDLPAGSVLELVSGPIDRPGAGHPYPATTSHAMPARHVHGGRFAVDLDIEPTGTYLRAQVRDETGTIVGAGNPTWLLPESSDIDPPPGRLIEER